MDKMHDQLKCPVCGRRLIDSRKGIRTQLALASEAKNADYFTKCWSCGNEIGIKKIE